MILYMTSDLNFVRRSNSAKKATNDSSTLLLYPKNNEKIKGMQGKQISFKKRQEIAQTARLRTIVTQIGSKMMNRPKHCRVKQWGSS